MGLTAGTRLGPYEIVSPLGAGGMGEVYKARDTRLDRIVAIKILPEDLACDPLFRERFDREARAVSQLDHPHICALYDVGQQDGIAYLVMQYLEGETLALRLERGALPRNQAITYAIQMADALSRAHRAGIIHRDLKPANIILTQSGARLLDFGLAKTSLPTDVAGMSLATRPAGLTAQGTILGTFQYMAPEQLEGRDADARSDIWAFGCVLYEMLTRERSFNGTSPASLIASIMDAEPPPLRERQPSVTTAVEHIVHRCLAKDPDARWQAVADVGHELRWAAAEDGAARVPVRPIWQWTLVFGAVALFVIIASAAVARMRRAPLASTTMPPLKLTLLPPGDLTLTPFASSGTPHFALAPDGRRIAFVASALGRPPTLWIRPLDSRAAQEIPGSDDASSPFWSSDGQSLGFFAEGRVKTIRLQGERPSTLATVIDAAGATWSGDVILIGRNTGPIARVPAGGGALTDATDLHAGPGGHRWPQFLPDGRHFIYTDSRGSVMLAALDSNASTILANTRSTAVYASPGFVLFVPPGSIKLMAQAIDPASFTAMGPPHEALDQVRQASGAGYPPVSVSANGLLAYWDGTTVATDLEWFDRQGNRITALPVPARTHGFAISPTGSQVAFIHDAGAGSTPSIWLMDATGATSRFSFTASGATAPIFSADGRQLLFTSIAGGQPVLLRRPVSGAEKEQLVGTVPSTQLGAAGGTYYATDWSRDARTALISASGPETGRDVLAFSADTGGVTPLFHGPAHEIQARFSPDDHWIAYASNETGRWEVFVEPFPPSGPRSQVSIEGGAQPVWRRDGRELFFLAPDTKLMAVAVTPSATFVHASPHALFETRMRPTYAPYGISYDVTADAQRFLIDSVRRDTGPTISVVVNWTAVIPDNRK